MRAAKNHTLHIATALSAALLFFGAGCAKTEPQAENSTGGSQETSAQTTVENNDARDRESNPQSADNQSDEPATSAPPETAPSASAPTQLAPRGNSPIPETQVAAEAKVITIVGSNFKFSPAKIKVKKGDLVKIVFQNSGGMHDWVIDEFSARTPKIGSGQSAEISFTANKTGAFEYYCSVGEHRAMGMTGILIVE